MGKMITMYKIAMGIDKIDKDEFFKPATLRDHKFKLRKKNAQKH